MIVLGIDPGITNTGYGVVEEEGGNLILRGCGFLTTPRDQEMSHRLQLIYQGVREVIKDVGPDVAAVEELFFSSNMKTVMAVGQARGVILLACEHENVLCVEYTPLQVKKALVGRGNADKRQVKYMVSALLKLDQSPGSTHASDALALSICHLQHQKLGNLQVEKGHNR